MAALTAWASVNRRASVGKRSTGVFPRRAQDAYDTPPEAVLPLLPHLLDNTSFYEPCAGNGHLVSALQDHGHICKYATDIQGQILWSIVPPT